MRCDGEQTDSAVSVPTSQATRHAGFVRKALVRPTSRAPIAMFVHSKDGHVLLVENIPTSPIPCSQLFSVTPTRSQWEKPAPDWCFTRTARSGRTAFSPGPGLPLDIQFATALLSSALSMNFPLILSFSPSGGEGARRVVGGELVQFMVSRRVRRAEEAFH